MPSWKARLIMWVAVRAPSFALMLFSVMCRPAWSSPLSAMMRAWVSPSPCSNKMPSSLSVNPFPALATTSLPMIISPFPDGCSLMKQRLSDIHLHFVKLPTTLLDAIQCALGGHNAGIDHLFNLPGFFPWYSFHNGARRQQGLK
ncbi:hypothetical protein D3C84_1024020 [compost metagenome]